MNFDFYLLDLFVPIRGLRDKYKFEKIFSGKSIAAQTMLLEVTLDVSIKPVLI